MNYQILSTRIQKPDDEVTGSLKTVLMENKSSWKGDWYAWEHEVKNNKHTTNKWRLNALIGPNKPHEILSLKRFDDVIFSIGDVIRHNQTDEYNKSIIKSFRIVQDHITKEDVYEVSFDLKGGGFFTCRVDQIEIWQPTESFRFEILDVRELTQNKKLLLL